MKKMVAIALAGACFLGAGAAGQDDASVDRVNGEILLKPGAERGKIVVMNGQEKVGNDSLEEVIETFNVMMRLPIEVRQGEFKGMPSKARVKELGATLAIIVREDSASEDILLVAPESMWAVLNTAPLATDAPSAEVLSVRVKKEFVRAFALLCGGANSDRAGMPTTGVTSLKDLDAIRPVCYPLDAYRRTMDYLRAVGVAPYVKATYRQACMEGWAPQPTNAVQRAIWDKVHEIPSKPMKIKFDPNKKKSN